ncbi:helix-turn-helix domain containing protein [Planctomycetota bacterium]|nr:helix-turn-helix domain containing protein [Planctomycetota bacterium]
MAGKKKKAIKAEVDPVVVAKNFISQYSKGKLKKFIRMLDNGMSGEAIAQEYGVSRERVRQWKNAFGSVVTRFEPSDAIKEVAGL